MDFSHLEWYLKVQIHMVVQITIDTFSEDMITLVDFSDLQERLL